MPDRPNIVIFLAEQWRGDAVGIAGHPIVKTPNIDRLAETGTYFTNCFTPHPICGPSRCSLASGWYPFTRGHRTQEYLLQRHEPNLLRHLKRAGYTVGWFGKNDMLAPEVIDESVDVCGRLRGEGKANPYDLDDPRQTTFYHGKWDGPSETHGDNRTVQRALRFCREADGPFAVLINTSFVHPPYRCEEPWLGMYDPAEVDPPIPAELEGKPGFFRLLRRYHNMDRVDEDHVRKMRACYYAMCSRTDDLFGRCLAELEEANLLDPTAVFFLSDHGNYTGDFGAPTKWLVGLEDSLLRVPFGMRIPGVRPGGVRHELIQHFDLYQTVLEIAGAQSDWPHFSRSLLPLAAGDASRARQAVFAGVGHTPDMEEPVDLDRRHALVATVEQDKRGASYYPWAKVQLENPDCTARAAMVRTDAWKYIRRSRDADELYDLARDPQERRNLLHFEPESHAAMVADLRGRLTDWLMLTADVMPPTRDTGGPPLIDE